MFLFSSISLTVNAQIPEKMEDIKNMKVFSGSIIQKKRPLAQQIADVSTIGHFFEE